MITKFRWLRILWLHIGWSFSVEGSLRGSAGWDFGAEGDSACEKVLQFHHASRLVYFQQNVLCCGRDILSLFSAQLVINEGGIISVVLFLSSLHFHQQILITCMQECAGSIQHCGRWRWNRRNYCWPVLQCHCVSFDLCGLSNNFLRRLIFWSFWMTRKWKSPP